jgi:hypothetical protein
MVISSYFTANSSLPSQTSPLTLFPVPLNLSNLSLPFNFAHIPVFFFDYSSCPLFSYFMPCSSIFSHFPLTTCSFFHSTSLQLGQQTARHCTAKYGRGVSNVSLARALIPIAVTVAGSIPSRVAVLPYRVAYFLMQNKHHKLLSLPPATN